MYFVQAQAGDQILFRYIDSLDVTGGTIERTDFTVGVVEAVHVVETLERGLDAGVRR